MDFKFIAIIIFLVILITIQFTLNKILRELKIISMKLDRINYEEGKYDR
ncbi:MULTISPECIES: hypothetical protein [Peptoniphilus]|nr:MULTISPECIES: hypothetical protein [Peptoniphilus]